MISNINHTPLRTFSSIEDYVKRFKNPYNLRPKQAGYHLLSPELHYADGWRNVVTPTLGENQRLGSLVYDAQADVVTYAVIDLSPEEIAQREQNAIDSDASAQKLSNDIANGQAMYQKFFTHIQRQFDKGNLTANQARNSVTLLWLPLLPINYGQFIVAQINLNALTPPVNAKELAILNLAKQEISEYLAK